MTPELYLRERMETYAQWQRAPHYRALSPGESNAEYAFAILTSKKFRKWKISDDYTQTIKQSISYAIANNKPLELAWFFGGYKLWSLPSAPEPDWAEFFSLAYLLNYASPVASVYKPGIKIMFWAAHPSIMARQSNYRVEECLAYRRSFRVLLDHFKPYWPAGLSAELHCFDELYPNEEEYRKELELAIAHTKIRHDEMPDEIKAKKYASSRLNIRWHGAENWQGLSDKEKEERIKFGPVVHDGYCRLSKIQEAVRGLGKIDLTATPLLKVGSVPVGTTKASVTKFWTGVGILEQRDNNYSERVLSPEQYKRIQGISHQDVPVNLISLKNFSRVPVFSSVPEFSRSQPQVN